MQRSDAELSVYIPATQSLQVVEPCMSLCRPRSQFWQEASALSPVLVLAFPSVQFVHASSEVSPSFSEYFPAEHLLVQPSG